MNIEVNGETRALEGPLTVGELVDAEVADRRGVGVALDGQVLPRRAWDDTAVDEGARLEIVAAVQGG